MKKILFLLSVFIFSINLVAAAISTKEASKILFKKEIPVTMSYLGTPYNTAGLKAHAGIDFGATLGTKVYSPVSGKVVYSKNSYGTVSIKIDNKNV